MATRPRSLSVDAWVMRSPTHAFTALAALPPPSGAWIALRRPFFLAFVLGSLVSVLASGSLTLRIVAPATLYWAFAPLIEVLALAAVTWTRRRRTPFTAMTDAFFTGHGPWTLYLIVLVTSVVFIPFELVWSFLTTWCLVALLLVLAWSAYIDLCFFRTILGASRARAVLDVLLTRLLTWPFVFGIFAVPGMDPSGLFYEVAEAIKEVLR